MIIRTKHPQIAPALIDTHAHLVGRMGDLFNKASYMFILSKLFDILTSPANLLLVLLIGLSLLGLSRWRSWQRPLLAALSLLLLGMAVVPWSSLLLSPLEDRYASTALPEHVDGVVVLGGALDPVVSAARGQVAANGAVERLTALIWLGRRYPQARLVFSGGSGSLTTQDLKEAPVARQFLEELGFDAARVVFEGESRNTRENALYTKQIMAPRPGEVWLLVTSALHMPRAMGAFAAVDWPIAAYPVDYLTTGATVGWRFDLAAAFSVISNGLHEWLGLLYYRWRGWSTALFPGP